MLFQKLLNYFDEQIIKSSIESDTYFDSDRFDPSEQKHLTNQINYGLISYAPVILDLTKIPNYLIDGIEIILKLTLHDISMILNTPQYNATNNRNGKKYTLNLSDIYLSVRRIKPTTNSYNALMEALESHQNYVPTLDSIFTSHDLKTYHLPSGIISQNIDMPWSNKIPDRIFIAFQKYSHYNTRDFKDNGLYFDHLNLTNILVTINNSTIYNLKFDFTQRDVSELYNITLNSIRNPQTILTFEKFLEGMSIICLNLKLNDEVSSFKVPNYGVLRIVLNFKTLLNESAIVFLCGDLLNVLTINKSREIVLSKS